MGMRLRITVANPDQQDWEVYAPTSATDDEILKKLELDPSQCVIKSTASGRPEKEQLLLCEGALISVVDVKTASHLRQGILSGSGSCLTLLTETGKDVGRIFRLPVGSTLFGRGLKVQASISDEEMSRTQFRILASTTDAKISDEASTNGTFVNHQQITAETILKNGDVVSVGNTSWRVAISNVAPVAMNYTTDRTFQFNRTFRIDAPFQRLQIDWPSSQADGRKSPFPWITAIAPALIGVVMATVSKNAMYLLMAVMSPMVFILNTVVARRQLKKESNVSQKTFKERLAAAEGKLISAAEDERKQLTVSLPDEMVTASIAQIPTQRLWERRSEHADFLQLRVGIGSRLASIDIKSNNYGSSSTPPVPELTNVPIAISLKNCGVLGIAGERENASASSRWFALQSIVFHSPDDLLISVLSEGGDEEWSWLRWAPHTQAQSGFNFVATTAANVDLTLITIREILDHRALEQNRRKSEESSDQTILIFMDNAAKLRIRPDVAALLRLGPPLGVYFVCIDEGLELLPEECKAVVDLMAGVGRVTIREIGQPQQTNVVADSPRLEEAELSARSMAPIRRVDAAAAVGSIPKSVRLLDELGLSELTPEAIVAGWEKQTNSMNVSIGVGENGQQYLDFVKDGPHGLVAGMTGAGKSEFLQTFVAALAIANRPEKLQFIFIDYKGGATFRPLINLPHTAGVVTNLNALLTRRALASLNAEMKRRQTTLEKSGVADFNKYESLSQKDSSLPKVPRLLIVIDEFKELKENLPDFIDGLDGLVRLGRSLGMHLVLATQRTSGAVTPEIRANSNWRVSLRVASDSESADLLDTPDAARLPNDLPGRGYIKIGADRAPIQFQSGYVGGISSGGNLDNNLDVNPYDWNNPKTKKKRSVSESNSNLTDLQKISDVLIEATKLSRLEVLPKIWAPPLPEIVKLDLDQKSDDEWSVDIGLHDEPVLQRVSNWPIVLDENYLILGSARSGRTTLLRTFAAAAATKFSADSVHLYVIDGGNSLAVLDQLPHVGAVVPRGQTERMRRLLKRLADLTEKRSEELSTYGISNLREQWNLESGESRFPRTILLIDRWESVGDDFEDNGLDDLVLKLLSQGPSVGVSVIITGDESVLRTRIQSRVNHTLVLKVNDENVAQRAGISVANSSATTDLLPGRGLLLADASEIQIGVLRDGIGQPESAAIGEIAKKSKAPKPATKPVKVVLLSPKQSLTLLLEAGTKQKLILGIGGDDGEVIKVVVSDGFLVTSQARKGRSSALLALCRSAIDQGLKVTVIAPKPSPLNSLSKQVNLISAEDIQDDGWTTKIPAKDLIFIDDYESLSTNSDLASLINFRRGSGVFVAVDLDACSIPNANLRAAMKIMQQTMLICPPDHLTAQSVGVQIQRGTGFSTPAGRGLMLAKGHQTLTQVGFDN
jgi:S-DNA-T family DNA segregation ATPase FtsK/SpoIIIE